MHVGGPGGCGLGRGVPLPRWFPSCTKQFDRTTSWHNKL